MAKKARKKSKAGEIIITVIGISVLVGVFVAAAVFAPDDHFADTEFVQDIGRKNSY